MLKSFEEYGYVIKDGVLCFVRGPFSQWYCGFPEHEDFPFLINDLRFKTCEQFMMYSKAYVFNDEGSKIAILTEPAPKINQEQGRFIKNFDQKTWDEEKFD